MKVRYENVLVSLDGHTEGFVDLRSHLPRAYHDDFMTALAAGKAIFHKAEQYYAALVKAGFDFSFEVDPDLDFDPERFDLKLTPQERLERTDADGVAAELIIDGFGAVSDDPGLAHQISLAYNRWFADTYLATDPDRFRGVVVVNMIAGVDTVIDEIRDAHAHGLSGIHLPGIPATADRDLPHYNHEMYEPLWRTLDEFGMLAIFHASIGREKPRWRMDGSQRAALALELMDINHSHETAVAPLLLAGVPERYPAIRFGWIESGCTWVPAILDACDMYFHGSVDHPAHRLEMKPTEQWRQSCFTAGPITKADVATRDRVGIETICFGSDFIHVEGTYPHSRRRLTDVLADLTPEERYAICTSNGARILDLDLERLAGTRAAEEVWAY